MICNGDKFQIVRMCPPGEIHYFFTVDSIPVKSQSPSGKNIFERIQIESDYIKYVFEQDYMDELNNIREKLLYHRKKEDNQDDNSEEENQTINNVLTNLPKDKIIINVDTRYHK